MGAHVEFLQTLHPGHHEEIATQHVVFDLALARFLLLLLEGLSQRDGRASHTESVNLDLAVTGLPMGAGKRRFLLRHELGRQAELGAGGPVIDHLPADPLLDGLCRLLEAQPLVRIEDAGLLAGNISLKGLDRCDRGLAEVAVRYAVVVARPNEIELDGGAFGLRNDGISGRRFARRGSYRTGRPAHGLGPRRRRREELCESRRQ